MAVGEYGFPEVYPVRGLRLGTACAGIKENGRNDLVIVELPPKSVSAVVLTKNAFAAAPVIVVRKHISDSNPRWLLINSGNANAGTGTQGIDDALNCCRFLASLVDQQPEQVLPFSTGVIGEPLPLQKISDALPVALNTLSESGWQDAAEAIMTTDTRPKGASLKVGLDDGQVVISGICKGAGMIQPDMATMLCFIATNAAVDHVVLNECLKSAVNDSFNNITVDGDTSTNDACVLIATGRSRATAINAESQAYHKFFNGLQWVCKQLAEAIIRDAEGATKLMRVVVTQALCDEEARRVAMTVAQSPLVKTALFAADPNWGRILAAVGRAGIPELDISRVCIRLGDVDLVEKGERCADYTEEMGQSIMSKDEITIGVSLGRGRSEQCVLGCDLSYDYVRLNAEYRT